MAMFDDQFHYHTDLEGRGIRLMQVSLSPNSEIRSSLTTKSLDEGFSYDALSYVWGDASKKRRITCDGKRLDVTENLYAALKYVSQRRPDTFLWVDAICINQTNTAEKSSQVRMMADIYTQARQVVFWLGDEKKNDHEAYAMAKLIASTTTDTNPIDSLSLFDSKWASLSTLLARPWFSRIWIVQEFLMASSGIFVCGRLEMQPHVIMKAAGQINARLSLRNSVSINSDLERQSNIQAVFNAGNLAFLVETASDYGKSHLLELLFATRNFHATDRRDKIFALLALSDDFPGSIIDYGKTTEELLFELTTRMLTDDSTLPSPIALLSYAVNNMPDKNIPSWIPDWINQEYVTIPVAHLMEMVDVADECHFLIEPSKTLRVRGKIIDRVVTIIWPTPYTTSIAGKTMRNLITETAPVYDWHETASQLAFATETYPTGMETSEAFWRTLAGDGAGLTELSLEHRSAYLAWQALLRWPRFERTKFDTTRLWNKVELALLALVNISYVSYGLLTWHSKEAISVANSFIWFFYWTIAHACVKMTFGFIARHHPDYLPNLQARQKEVLQLTEKANLFELSFGRASAGRRFCRTEKGYLGWVSLHAQEGDPVVTLLGCRILFTVRSINRTTGEDGPKRSAGRQYRLTGDCLVYGLMKGEALQIEEPMEDIAIV